MLKPIPGYEDYHVDENGNIFSTKFNKLRKIKSNPDKKTGYLRVYLYVTSNPKKAKLVHRLVLETFRGPCPAGKEACHNNGNNSKNNLDNLRWGTPKSNHADMKKHGTLPMGETHVNAKLTESKVHLIRGFPKTKGRTAYLSKMLGVSKSAIKFVISRRTWRHI